MHDGYFKESDLKFEGETLACFYTSMALNRELMGDLELAYQYYL